MVVLCVAAATTFWILNALNKDDYTTIVDFPIEFSFDQENYMAVKPLPESVQIEISGNGWDLLRKYFNVNNTPYILELDRPANSDYILTSDLKRTFSEFITPTQLVSIVDDSIHYQIDPIRTVKLTPVLDTTSFSLAENFRLVDQPVFEPNQITVKGPESIIELFEGKYPINLDENRLKDDLTKNIELSASKELEKFISLEEKSVAVSLDLVAFLEGNKRLKIKKINFPRTVSLEEEDPLIMMYYLVDERKTDELKEIEFEAILDFAKRNKQDSTIDVQVRPMPAFLDQVRIEPSRFRLRYE
ncbi:YbbR-like domain-containing protein [Algoriphagus sp.]|uniref:YbbR-like domain-containing protein n=1 Tax=Algoriphagus sp. TaxID=1872435 RepID=UPI002622827C|nr:YbbR-like domain-containing protein [Algoriphagus sp.]